MHLSESFLQELKSRSDIEQLISSYVTLKRRGNTLVGLCPFHNEKTGSFTVYPQTSSFYCFGCGAAGDAISFMMKIENLDYMEAVKTLADRAGLQIPEDGYDDSMQKLRMKIYEINRSAARFFYNTLISPQGKEGLDYFRERKLSPQTIKHFGLGFAPDSWDALYRFMKSKGYSDDLLIQANLVIRKRNGNGCIDRFRKRVMYPIIDLRGNVIAFGGRILPGDDSPAKYINTSDTPVYKKTKNIYALNLAKNSKRDGLILCEGYMDVISMHQAGFDNAVAACGTSFTDEQAKLLSRYANQIIVTMDADSAGEKSTDRTIRILQKTGMTIRVLRLPDAKDPDEYIKKHGPERFGALLDGAGNEIEYKLHAAEQKYDTSTDNGKLEYLRAAADILADIRDEIARELYSARVAEKQSIPLPTFKRAIENVIKQKRRSYEKKQVSQIISGTYEHNDANPERRRYKRASTAEETIISILFTHPEMYRRAELSSDMFVTQFNRRVYERMQDILVNGYVPDVSLFSGVFSPEEMGNIVSMINNRIPGDAAQKELADCIRVLSEEKAKATAADPSEMNDDEWADNIKKIGDSKKGVKN